MTAVGQQDATATYRRTARRLRARFRSQPALLQAALGDLARRQDRGPRRAAEHATDAQPAVVIRLPDVDRESTTTAVVRGFTDHVAEQLRGPVLRYSQRLDLLNAADRLGIGRFRANLIIAMVQHARGDQVVASEDAPRDESPHRWRSTLGAVILALMIESVVVVSWIWFVR